VSTIDTDIVAIMPIIIGKVSAAIAFQRDPTVKSREDLLIEFLIFLKTCW
jgi:hypothetical protein